MPNSEARQARKQAGFKNAEALARRLACSAEKVRSAERAGGRVTFRTALKLSALTNTPGNLYLYATCARAKSGKATTRSGKRVGGRP